MRFCVGCGCEKLDLELHWNMVQLAETYRSETHYVCPVCAPGIVDLDDLEATCKRVRERLAMVPK